MDEGQLKEAEKTLDKALEVLGEYFNDIVILASTVNKDGETVYMEREYGNDFSKEGMAKKYLDSFKEGDWYLDDEKT